jgi:hypothetical protein
MRSEKNYEDITTLPLKWKSMLQLYVLQIPYQTEASTNISSVLFPPKKAFCLCGMTAFINFQKYLHCNTFKQQFIFNNNLFD